MSAPLPDTQVLSCLAHYGAGGLGRHFAQLVEETRQAGRLDHYYAKSGREGDAHAVVVPISKQPWYKSILPFAWRPRLIKFATSDKFDRAVAERLAPSACFTGFAGKALHTMQRARALGADRLEVVAPNSHVNDVQRLHRRAAEQSGIRDTWLSDAERRKTLQEYAAADVVLVHSNYTRDSLLRHGVPEVKLHRTTLRIPARFHPPAKRPDDGVLRLAYVGRLDATKGVVVLLDAFRRLPVPTAELQLIGGWASRPLRRLVEAAMAADPRITVAPGDPVPALQRADVYIHPTYEDGYAYSPAEALACGVPVIVTEETGMKEYVREGENGYVVPVGDADAIIERLLTLRERPLATTNPLLDTALIAASDDPAALAAASSDFSSSHALASDA